MGASTPPPYQGHNDHSFTLQAVMEMQKSIGELKALMVGNTRSIDELKVSNEESIKGLKTKVDDLIGWKNKVLGGAVALGVVCTLLGFVIAQAAKYLTITPPTPPTTAPQATAPPMQSAMPPAPTKRP